MKKRWNALVRLDDGEIVNLILRGWTEEEAHESALEYRGVTEILKIEERVFEKTFPTAPAHLVDIHYRPLRRDNKVFHG